MRLLLTLALLSLVIAATSAEVDDPTPDYGRDVRPILSRNCFVCHGPDESSREQELRFDSFAEATRDRGGYRAIVPGDSAESEAFARITDGSDPMPPLDSGHALTSAEVDVLRRWIDSGAEYAQHWAFVAPQRSALPDVRNADWPRNGIDQFVLARLEREQLRPAPEADRATLARRASLDIIGLPPTLEDVQAFVHDEEAGAYERYIDGLLASPAYGERWASVWLDLARYADSSGHGSDPLRVIWRYRDWVIDALNANQPFDQFTIEQLAGDLLQAPTLDQRLATAFHRNTMTNTEGGTDDEEFRVAAVKDRAITTAQVWLGLTLGCAQCHSHKFDPLSQEEFYSFFAFFNQTTDNDRPDDSPRIETPRPSDVEAVTALRAQIEGLEADLNDSARDVSAALAAWELERRAEAGTWHTLEPVELVSTGGAQLARQDDGSILASGPSPEKDVTTFVAQSPFAGVTAVRLEVLPHDSLAQGGPGRAPGNGNVVLNDVRLDAAPSAAAPAPNARYVRVTNLGHDVILSLAEVQVFSAGENVARAGTATQSSTAFNGPPDLALDGETNGDFQDAHSVTHTATEDDPWWELDLGRSLPLTEIRLWNRTDGALHRRLAGFLVVALDDERSSVWSAGIRRPPEPSLALDLTTGTGEVLLANASADYSDVEWAVGSAIDLDEGTTTGWGLNPSLGGAHLAVFETASPLAGPYLRLQLQQEFGAHHTLGRFRIAVTDRPLPVRALPHDVETALATLPVERTDAQQAALKRHYQTIDPRLKEIRARIAQLEQEIKSLAVPTTPVMVELAADKRRDTHVMLRGSFLDPGQAVEAAVPAVLHEWREGERDRLGLAHWLVRSDNPLTARVTANRVWARIFGRGIVETEENFGAEGSPPSHPQLLDWLALALVDGGWDMKAFLKTIVASATYRQASDVTPEHVVRDPANVLCARGPRFRMDAEMVRDVLLATSGLLSRKMHGPSVYPPQPPGLWQAAFNGQRDWVESKGEDRWRRALYVFLRRTVPYPSLETFDSTSRESCTLRRSRTNTPLQAFVTLNDPVYVEAAQAFARRIAREGGADTRSRAEFGLSRCLLRPPSAERVAVVEALYASELAHFRADETAATAIATEPLGPLDEGESVAELAAWTVVANVLLNQDSVLVKD